MFILKIIMYDIYFKDDYDVNHDIINDSNGSNEVIDGFFMDKVENGFFMDKVEVECKENMKCAQQKKKLLI